MTALIIFLVVAIAVGAILIYRNNQKKIEAEASKIKTTATTIVDDAKKI